MENMPIPQINSMKIIEKPAFLSVITTLKGSHTKKIAISKIAEKLKGLEPNKCLEFEVEEFEQSFGFKRHHAAKAYMLKILTQCGIHQPIIIRDDKKFYIYSLKKSTP